MAPVQGVWQLMSSNLNGDIHLLDILTSYSADLSVPVDAALHLCAGWWDTNYHGQAAKCVLTPLQSGLSYPPPTRISRSLSLDGSV